MIHTRREFKKGEGKERRVQGSTVEDSEKKMFQERRWRKGEGLRKIRVRKGESSRKERGQDINGFNT
jgi:hypothetical protein